MNLLILNQLQLRPNLCKENLHLIYRLLEHTREHPHTDRFEAFY